MIHALKAFDDSHKILLQPHPFPIFRTMPNITIRELKAIPIYLLLLQAQEVGNGPFWNKKKVEKCDQS